MTTRCKFECISKREFKGWGQSFNEKPPIFFEYEFQVVHGNNDENKTFFASTPSGSLKVSVVRDGTFEVGKEYYLDLTVA